MEGFNDKDYFSRLPNELVEAILVDARIRGPPTKRFLPIFRRNLYRRIFLRSYESLHLLTRTAHSHPEFLEETKEFTLDVLSADEDNVDADPKVLTDDELLSFLKSLTRVHTLEINGSQRLGQIAFHTKSPLPCFATVKTLHLEFPTHDVNGKYDYFDPVEFIQSLSRYTALVSLYFATSPATPPRWRDYPEEPDMSQLPSLDRITTLHLGGGSLCNVPTLSYLAPHLPSLTDITFDNSVEDRSSDEIFEFLRYIPNPDLVTTLSLLFDDVNEAAAVNLVDIISHFTNLGDLSLQNLPMETVYPHLSSLPLRRLTFNHNPTLSTATISRLLSGPNKITTLETLCLDNFFASEGDPIPDHYYPSNVSRDIAYRWGWLLADWTRAFSEKGLGELEALGKREGIKVEGQAFHAIEVEALWQKALDVQHQARLERDEDSDDGSEYQIPDTASHQHR
ncbi:hypothetical protein JCM5353_001567 [Sporobolomyces roseus]